jgi:glycosyltransferase involved in cell wall biosynthesis
MNCCFCGPVKNCGLYLERVLKNIELLAQIFDDYKIIIFYDHSTDNTLQILKQFQKTNDRVIFYVNPISVSQFRTHRIAYARNFCLNYIFKNKDIYPYFIMMDFDDVNCKNVNPQILKKYLSPEYTDKWDGLSFNTNPRYYDIWGLSIYPFCFSYNHFTNNKYHNYNVLQDYVEIKLRGLKDDKLLQCISSFNGFSIYRTNKFINCLYDGKVRLDLIPQHLFEAHLKASRGKFVMPDFGHIKAQYEDCEHRAFHIEAATKNSAKIMISPDKIFY